MKGGVIRRLRGFHRDEGGQSIVFIALTILFVVLFVFMIINTGDVTTKKMRMVTAADSVAVSGATWMARGYNVTAMINVAMSQILAIIILIKATKMTYEIAKGILEALDVVAQILEKIPYTAAVGAALHVYAKVGTEINKALENDIFGGGLNLREELDNDGDGYLWDVEKVLTKAEQIFVKVVPFIAQIESIRLARANDATFGFLYPMIPLVDSKIGLKLPFIDDDDREFKTLCKPTKKAQVNFDPSYEKDDGSGGREGGNKKVEHLPTTGYMGSSGVLGDILGVLTLGGTFGPAPLDYFKAFTPYPPLRIPYPMIGAVYDAVVAATWTTMCTDSPGVVEFENTSEKCSECWQHRNELIAVEGGSTIVTTKRSRSEASSLDFSQLVDTITCDTPASDPRCREIRTVDTPEGPKTIYGYTEVKHFGTDAITGGQHISLTDSAAQSWLRSLGSDCKNRTDPSCFSTTYFENLYDDQTDATQRQRDQDGNVIPITLCTVSETKLTSCKWRERRQMTQEDVWGSGGSGGGSGGDDDKKPKPYLLKRDKEDGKQYWRTRKDYVGIVYRKPKPHVLSGRYLKNPNPLGMIYFSQAEIYVSPNSGAHLFNQCWRVRLVRFNKLSDVKDGVNSGNMSQMSGQTGEGLGGSSGGFISALQGTGAGGGNILDKYFLIH